MACGMTDDAIRAAAFEFRSMVERTDRSHLPLLRSFPEDSWGDAAILLGEFLATCGLGDWDQCAGERTFDHWTHAWIERDGLIVDITASQFDEVDKPVVVTRDRRWYRQFEPLDRRSPARIRDYDDRTARMLWSVYRAIVA